MIWRRKQCSIMALCFCRADIIVLRKKW
jgi:hypothetical protein